MSSSAALLAGFGLLLAEAWPWSVSREELVHLCRRAENEFLGVPCGLMDPAAVLLGEKKHILLLDCHGESWIQLPFPEDEVEILVMNTGLAHELAEGHYRQRVLEVAAVKDMLDRNHIELHALHDCSAERVKQLANGLPAPLDKRLLHLHGEMTRVQQAATMLQRGDIQGLGELMTASHWSLAHDFQVSCDELDFLVSSCSHQPAVLGAKLTGAGFGGAAIALVRRGHARAVSQDLAEQYPKHFQVALQTYICSTADGARCW